MAVSVNYNSSLTVRETLAYAGLSTGDKVVTHDVYNTSHSSLGAASTPPCTKAATWSQALSAGAATVDLTAIPGVEGSFSGSGLKVQFVKFKNPSSNANAITIGEGASNGYELLGNGWTMTLQPGQEALVKGNDATPDVGGSAKTIDLAGTGTQALQISIVLG